jgi:hypothetical protein
MCCEVVGSPVLPLTRAGTRTVLTGGAATRDNEGMVHGSEETVAFRLWPPVAIGAPLLGGWLVTLLWGDPVDLGGWRRPLGWGLVLFFAGWNGWSLWLFRRHETGLLPGQATRAMIEDGPYRLSRNPLYVGLLALYLGLALLAPTFWGPARQGMTVCSAKPILGSSMVTTLATAMTSFMAAPATTR